MKINIFFFLINTVLTDAETSVFTVNWKMIGDVIAQTIGTIALINLIAVIVQLSREFSKLRGDNSKILRIISLGILGGLFGIYGSITGYDLNGMNISIRDLGPMMSGLLGGPLAGLIAGFIAGLFRLLSGISAGILNGSTIPCSIATVLIGFLTGIIYKHFRPKGKLRILFAFLLGMGMEILHLLIIFVYFIPSKGAYSAFTTVLSITIPFLLANGIGFAILVYVIYFIKRIRGDEVKQKNFEAELNAAKNIQSSMLPAIFPDYPGRKEMDIAALMNPAKEVGGDFYDFFFIDDDHFCFLVADVSGKGAPAALFMVIAKTLIKSNVQTMSSLKEAIEKTNNQLVEGNKNHMFVTAWIGILEFSTGLITYTNCGHNPPLISKYNDGYYYLKNRSGIVLGGKKNSTYKEYQVYLLPTDKIFLYTDGVTEAMNAQNEEFGEPRFLETINSIDKSKTASQSIEIIGGAIKDFVKDNEQSDDITMLSISMNGETNYLKLGVSSDNFDHFNDFIDKSCKDFAVSMKDSMKLKVVFDEIYSNILKYSKATYLILGISLFEGDIKLVFKYDGDDFDITKEKDPDVSLSSKERKEGGLGLFIVRKTMDKVIFKRIDGLNVLYISKKKGE